MTGFVVNFLSFALAMWTARLFLRDGNYYRFAATLVFAVILAVCGIMALSDEVAR